VAYRTLPRSQRTVAASARYANTKSRGRPQNEVDEAFTAFLVSRALDVLGEVVENAPALTDEHLAELGALLRLPEPGSQP
jgi:hypothetical protein